MGKKYLASCIILLGVFAAETASAQQIALSSGIQTIDRIVAVVNETVVTRHELDQLLKATVKQLQKQGVQPPSPLCSKSSCWNASFSIGSSYSLPKKPASR